jgi:hypothetical protein
MNLSPRALTRGPIFQPKKTKWDSRFRGNDEYVADRAA